MRKFYIGTTEKQIEMSYTLVETLDETLDNMTVSLALESNGEPYKPLNRFYVKECWYHWDFSAEVLNSIGTINVGDEITITNNSDTITGIITEIDADVHYVDFSAKFKINNVPFNSGQIELIKNNTNKMLLDLDGHPIYDTTTEELLSQYIISADRVELETQNPLRYKHTLTLMQLSEYLTHHEIRNTVFSTSLETNRFVVEAARCVYTKAEYVSPSSTSTVDPEVDIANMPVADQINATIDLKRKKIKQMNITPSFFSYIPFSLGWGGGGSIERYEYMNVYYDSPEKWTDFYNGLTPGGSAYPLENFYFPQVVFYINNERYFWRISTVDVYNNKSVKVPNEILEWIYSPERTGTELEIYIDANVFNPRTWYRLHKKCLEGKIPMLTSVHLKIEVDSIEMPVYDVIETMLKQQMKETKTYHSPNPEDPTDPGNDSTITPLFLMPTAQHNPDLYNLLKDTSSPNFIFTQSNFYDALVEIFKLFDAIFTIDKDGYLDIEYYNDHSKITLPNVAGKTSSITEEKFNDKLISYFQNTKIDDRFPNSNDKTSTAYIRSKTLGVPSQSDYVFMLPKPIDVLKKVTLNCQYSLKSFFAGGVKLFFYPINKINQKKKNDNSRFLNLDITDNVVDSSIWSLLPNNTANLNPSVKYKYNCFSYSRGSNYIDISGYYKTTEDPTFLRNQTIAVIKNVVAASLSRTLGLGENVYIDCFDIVYDNWHAVKLNVEYIALADGKLVIENEENKYNGEMIINQGNGSIDVNKLGLNMVGLSLKLGQPTLTMTQEFTTWDERIKKGQYVEINGERWVANVCNYTAIQDRIQATIEFVKNFNGLASRIQLNREKRLSNISNELTTKCEETYGEYIYYSDGDYLTLFSGEGMFRKSQEKICLEKIFLANQIAMTFNSNFPRYLVDTKDIWNGVHGLNLIVNKTITELKTFNGSRKNVYDLGTVYKKGIITNENHEGFITLCTNTEGTGDTIEIPFSSAEQGCLTLDEMTKNFNFNYYDNFVENEVTSSLIGNDFPLEVHVLVLKDGSDIIGAAITRVEDDFGFNSSNVYNYYEKNDYTIEYSLISSFNNEGRTITSAGQNCNNISIPLLVYGSGNSVCFEMSFDSPISAGNQLLDNYNGFWTDGWFSRTVLYTDTHGEADKFTINFVKMQEDLTRCYPQMVDNITDQNALSTYSFGKIEEFAYYKKPNEIFALNYQLHFLPFYNKLFGHTGGFISNEFIRNNSFKKGKNEKQFKFVYTTLSSNFEYSILDTKGEGTDANTLVAIEPVLRRGEVAGMLATLKFVVDMDSATQATVKTWAIVDDNNNIYYSCNNGSTTRTGNNNEYALFQLNFFSRHHKL